MKLCNCYNPDPRTVAVITALRSNTVTEKIYSDAEAAFKEFVDVCNKNAHAASAASNSAWGINRHLVFLLIDAIQDASSDATMAAAYAGNHATFRAELKKQLDDLVELLG